VALLGTFSGVAIYNNEATSPVNRLVATVGSIAIVNRTASVDLQLFTNTDGGTRWAETGLFGTRTPWIPGTLLNGYTQLGTFRAAFRLDGVGNVALRGAVLPPAPGLLGVTAFRLPIGFRPPGIDVQIANSNLGVLAAAAAGGVTVYGAGAIAGEVQPVTVAAAVGSVWFDGVQFSAQNEV
jgi:hypothetical protein